MTELELVQEQLEELLGAGAVDVVAALEIAELAGAAQRYGLAPELLEEASKWRKGPGEPLLEEAFGRLDMSNLADEVDGVAGADATEEEVEKAVLDFDDAVAAAVWSGRTSLIRAAALRVARTIRQVPEPFSFLAGEGRDIAKLRFIAEDLGLYDYWFAIADSGASDA